MLRPRKNICKTVTFDNCGELSGCAYIAQSLRYTWLAMLSPIEFLPEKYVIMQI